MEDLFCWILLRAQKQLRSSRNHPQKISSVHFQFHGVEKVGCTYYRVLHRLVGGGAAQVCPAKLCPKARAHDGARQTEPAAVHPGHRTVRISGRRRGVSPSRRQWPDSSISGGTRSPRSPQPHLSQPKSVAVDGIFPLMVEMDCDTRCQVELRKWLCAHANLNHRW